MNIHERFVDVAGNFSVAVEAILTKKRRLICQMRDGAGEFLTEPDPEICVKILNTSREEDSKIDCALYSNKVILK